MHEIFTEQFRYRFTLYTPSALGNHEVGWGRAEAKTVLLCRFVDLETGVSGLLGEFF